MDEKIDIDEMRAEVVEHGVLDYDQAQELLSRLEQAEQAASTLEQDRDYWKASALDSEQAVARVREKHSPVQARYYGTDLNPHREYDCDGCGEGWAWPCSNIRALDGDGRE